MDFFFCQIENLSINIDIEMSAITDSPICLLDPPETTP